MNELPSLLVTGMLTGLIYSLLALGFVIIYKSTKILNLAVSEFTLFGAYVVASVLEISWLPPVVGILFVLILGMLLGALTERLFLRPLIGESHLMMLVMTLAVSSIFFGAEMFIFSPESRRVQLFSTETLQLGGISLSPEHLLSLVIVVIALILLAFYFRVAKGGLVMQAVAEDHQVSQSLGTEIDRVFSRAWIFGSILMVTGGILLGSLSGANWGIGEIALKALPVVLLGGLESLPGAVVAGLIVGIGENLGAFYIDPLVGGGFKDVFPYILMILILLFRPYGIFGLKRIERV